MNIHLLIFSTFALVNSIYITNRFLGQWVFPSFLYEILSQYRQPLGFAWLIVFMYIPAIVILSFARHSSFVWNLISAHATYAFIRFYLGWDVCFQINQFDITPEISLAIVWLILCAQSLYEFPKDFDFWPIITACYSCAALYLIEVAGYSVLVHGYDLWLIPAAFSLLLFYAKSSMTCLIIAVFQIAYAFQLQFDSFTLFALAIALPILHSFSNAMSPRTDILQENKNIFISIAMFATIWSFLSHSKVSSQDYDWSHEPWIRFSGVFVLWMLETLSRKKQLRKSSQTNEKYDTGNFMSRECFYSFSRLCLTGNACNALYHSQDAFKFTVLCCVMFVMWFGYYNVLKDVENCMLITENAIDTRDREEIQAARVRSERIFNQNSLS